MTLNELTLGKTGIIDALDFPETKQARLDHLSQLGLKAGAEFQVVGRGFAGDPIAIQLSNNRIALGKNDARYILTRKS